MSKIALSGNASGTGTFSIAAPGTNTDRTLTLPDASGTVATTANVDAASSIVHLGTIATTSGSSVTLSGLTLTPYKQLQFFINGVSALAGSPNLRLNGYHVAALNTGNITDVVFGSGTIDLSGGVFGVSNVVFNAANLISTGNGGGLSGLTTASTSITFTLSASTFDAGSIIIYGVK
jgi:hypothetical protein